MKNSLFLVIVFIVKFGFSQNQAFQIYNAKGKKITYKKMIKSLKKSDIVLFGELHNNPIAHWLEFEVTKSLGKERNLILGAEMFERDNQDELNDYLSGKIDVEKLDSTARLWQNYYTDYAPLVNYAKENRIEFIATNIPRRFASLVYKKDFIALESLTEEEKSWIAKLPIDYDKDLPGYKKMLEMMEGHGGETFPKAQAIKDATMAESIYDAYSSFKKEEKQFVHYNGAYHSNNYEGILWYLKRKNDTLDYKTISTVSQKNIGSLLQENKGLADFIICIDEDMTSTY